jgi:hypothetical protein
VQVQTEVQDDRQGHFRLTHGPGARGAAQPRFDHLEFEDLLVDALDTVRHHDRAVKDARLTGRFWGELALR